MLNFEVLVIHAAGGFENMLIEATSFNDALTQTIALETGLRVIGICQTPDPNEACFTQLPFDIE